MKCFMVSFTRLPRVFLSVGVAALLGSLAVSAHAAPVIDWVTVGDPGNTADTTGQPNPAGAVADSFQIMKYEFTNQQYTDFLNSVAATDTYSLYHANMGSSSLRGGITRSGSSGSYTYATKTNMGDKPVNYVSWFDAARVSNWLMNGGMSSSSTETGAYTLSGSTSGNAPAVNPGATFYVPLEDQWYKAAYYKGGNTNAGYWDYATQSDSAPTAVTAGRTGIGSAGSTGNFANYRDAADWNSLDGNVTTVGTNGGPSAYGAFDMSGNTYEWNDLTGAAGYRGLRGGNWRDDAFSVSSSYRVAGLPESELIFGFRLASPVAVPEPSTCASLAAGCVFGCWNVFKGRRRRKASGISLSLLVLLVATCSVMAASAHAINYEMVPVGDAGNAADTTGYGAVPYEYQIGKYEVTIGQYAAFLNAVAKTDPNNLWNSNMPDTAWGLGISRTGSSGNYSYAAIGPRGVAPAGANSPSSRPIAFVNWFNSARFANWMSNGQPTEPQGPTTTENGAYAISGTTTAPARNAFNPNTGLPPAFNIPTENEWYKAAYYKSGGTNAGYWLYATRSDAVTGNSIGSLTTQANYYAGDWAVTQSSTGSSFQNYLTNVGAFSGSLSAYGTFDQSGNVSEWNDLTGATGSLRGIRGGGWASSDVAMSSTFTDRLQSVDSDSGFRLAAPVAVPEPSTCFSLAAGLVFGGCYVFKGRRRRTASDICRSLVAMLFVVSSVPSGTAHAIAYEMVPVGNAGNANDPATGSVYGGVAYDYQIGKYDVTIGQYTDFLNAVAATDTYSLYEASMAADPNVAGIARTGVSGSYNYSVIGPSGTTPAGASSPGNRPITVVGWFDSARFANWMANGQPTGAQSSTTTENGAYALSGTTTAPAKNVTNPNTSAPPTFFMPTENEWYKAAYYSPVLNSGSGGYYTYATQSNTDSGNQIGSGSNQANYNNSVFSVTQSASYSGSQNYLTDVGAFTNSASFYGTFDQSGNVWQWNDLTGDAGSSRGLRGGSWFGNAFDVSSSRRITNAPSFGDDGSFGFRLASPAAVPEPSTYAMALAGLACGGFSMWRRRKRVSSYRLLLLAAIVTVTVATAATPVFAQSVNYELVPVGDPGNAADTTGYGAVPYEYQIGKYEVTIGQYADFLNAVAESDPYGLWPAGNDTNPSTAGISRAGSEGSYTYNVIGPLGIMPPGASSPGNRPITLVSWFNAARFANWMHNGQGSGSTETGAYTLNGVTSGTAPEKNSESHFYIPTEDQWYKAAYYKGGGANSGYWRYATQSDTPPGNTIGAETNQANYYVGDYPNGSYAAGGGVLSAKNLLTDVGAFANSGSYYGTFDQNGNVGELNDLDGSAGVLRGYRGASWGDGAAYIGAFHLSSSARSVMDTSSAHFSSGFRLASPVAVPEPSTWVMGLAGIACGGWQMYRRRKRA